MNPVVTLYNLYFKHIAKMHPLLSHRDEVGSYAFDIVLQSDVKELTFTRGDVNPSGDFILLAVVPTLEMQEAMDGSVRRTYTGGFFILKKHTPRNNDKRAWWSGMADTEIIAIQILQRIVMDSRNKHPLFDRSCDAMGHLNYRLIERIIDEKWYGYLVTFNFYNIIPDCPRMDCAWIDNGISPFTY